MKQKLSKVWNLLFPPKCFGNEFKVAQCINYYWKHRHPKKLNPLCPVHDDCITETIRRELVKNENRSHSNKGSSR